MKQYKIYEVRYNAETDSFETWLAVADAHYPVPGDFDLEASYPCQYGMHDGKAKEPSLIHYNILKRIARAQDLGYEIIWRI